MKLIGDIGGTNCRFWLLDGEGEIVFGPWRGASSDYETVGGLLTAVLDEAGYSDLSAVVICVAGPVANGKAALTNFAFEVSVDLLAAFCPADQVRLINDFEAISLSLPHLTGADVSSLGGPDEGLVNAPLAVIGPGTGLGMGGLIPDGQGGFIPIVSEGGNAAAVPETTREWQIMDELRKVIGFVSVEWVVSGYGLCNLFRTIAALDGVDVPEDITPEQVAARAKDGCTVASEAMALFASLLGGAAGDLALTLGARGGVYVAGGIIPKWGDQFDLGLFRERFEAKGWFEPYVKDIPTKLIVADDPAFLGLKGLALSISRD